MATTLGRQGLVRLPALLLAATLTACVTPIAQTSVDRAAKAKSLPNAPFSNVMVVGIADQGTRGREFEEELVKALGNRNTTAFGYRRAASRADVKEEVVTELVRARGADAVVVVAARFGNIISEEQGERVDVESQVRGGGLVDFFRYEYQDLTKPPDTTMRMQLQFFTNVFDVEEDRRVYTLESTTGLAESSSEIILSQAGEIAKRLRKDRMVR
jgi:hypothetical protein